MMRGSLSPEVSRFTAARLTLAVLAACAASSCSTSEATNPFRWVPLQGALDFAVADDGRIAVVSNGVAWGTLSGVVVVDPETLVATRIADDPVDSVDVEGGDAYLYEISNSSNATVGRIPLDGGMRESLDVAPGSTRGYGGAVDATSVFLAAIGYPPSTKAIYRFDVATEARTTVAAAANFWGGLVGDDTHLYWINYDQTIQRVSKSGGVPEPLFSSADHPEVGSGQIWSLAVDPTSIYVGSDSSVFRVSKDTLAVEVIAADQPRARALTVDDSHLYWARGLPNRAIDYPGECDVVRRALGGGPIEILATKQNGVLRIEVTSERVIWNEWVPGDLSSVRLDEL